MARHDGVNLQTVRYYEREGLLAPAERTLSGYRIFRQETARRIRFIKRAQELGFSLSDIKELLSLRIDQHTTQADIRKRAQAKVDGRCTEDSPPTSHSGEPFAADKKLLRLRAGERLPDSRKSRS